MNEPMHTDSIPQAVLDRIREGTIQRRSRTYFAVRMGASLVLAFLLLAVSSLFVSLALFDIHESGEQFLLGYGLRGLQVFLALFPWGVFVAVIVLVLCLEPLARSFKKLYRLPTLALFLYLFAASAVIGAAVSLTPLHGSLLREQRTHGLPVIGGAYEHVLDRHDEHGVFRGIVVSVGTSSLTMVHDDADRDHDDGQYRVVMPANWDPETTQAGDRILIFGESGPDGIQAEHTQVLPPL